MSNFDLDNMEVTSTDDAENQISSGGSGRKSDYEPVAQKYTEIDKENESIVLRNLSNNDINNIRNLLYRRFGKEDVIVRSSKVSDDPERYDAVVRQREGGEYLRNNGSPSDADESTEESEDVSDEEEGDLEEVF